MEKELYQLDLYEILGIPTDADQKTIRSAYRKKALASHPDKNPDNPDAAKEFDRLKKVLGILLDLGAKAAYDRLLKARKAAAIRSREADAKSKKLRSDLEERERRAQENKLPKLSEEERFRRELKRLEEEGARLIAEEIEKVNREVEEQIRKVFLCDDQDKSVSLTYRVKAKWKPNEEWPGYTKEEIHQLFYKWGEINAVVVKNSSKKGTGLIEYTENSAADMAVQFERGLPGKPVEVVAMSSVQKPKLEKKKEPEVSLITSRDYESVADMNRRREEERQKLIQQMAQEDR